MSATRSSEFRLFTSFAGYRRSWLGPDLRAGLLLAAIALPEQLATARLAGLPPVTGLLAFAAGTLAFAAFGRNRLMSVGADSTIAPVIAGALSVLAVAGSAQYAGYAAVLAVLIGAILLLSRVFRMGWVANLLSIPVTTGLLIGIAAHIVMGQVPTVLDLPLSTGSVPAMIASVAAQLDQAHMTPLLVALAVLSVTAAADAIDPRLPGALLGILGSGLAVWWFGLNDSSLVTIDAQALPRPTFSLVMPSLEDFATLLLLAPVVALLCMIQTASVVQAFGSEGEGSEGVSRDFAAIGAGSIIAGLVGAFPVNSSPPRTGIVAEAGGQSQLTGLVAVVLCFAVVAFARTALSYVPHAALGGVLLFVAIRLVRASVIRRIWAQSPNELPLVVASAALVTLLPIGLGVGLGVVLSLLHSLYTVSRPNCRQLFRIPGTTIWWADTAQDRGERVPGVLVLALAAPLNFLSTKFILQQLDAALAAMHEPCRLVVLEGNSVVAIDFTGADLLRQRIEELRTKGLDVALARFESLPAIEAAHRTGLIGALGSDHVFLSVEEAVRTLARPEAAADRLTKL